MYGTYLSAVRESTRKHKKLDVYRDGEYVTSIGDIRYSDFLQHGDEERRKRYKVRHQVFRSRPWRAFPSVQKCTSSLGRSARSPRMR